LYHLSSILTAAIIALISGTSLRQLAAESPEAVSSGVPVVCGVKPSGIAGCSNIENIAQKEDEGDAAGPKAKKEGPVSCPSKPTGISGCHNALVQVSDEGEAKAKTEAPVVCPSMPTGISGCHAQGEPDAPDKITCSVSVTGISGCHAQKEPEAKEEKEAKKPVAHEEAPVVCSVKPSGIAGCVNMIQVKDEGEDKKEAPVVCPSRPTGISGCRAQKEPEAKEAETTKPVKALKEVPVVCGVKPSGIKGCTNIESIAQKKGEGEEPVTCSVAPSGISGCSNGL
jgi:hypothetical protein